MQWYTLDNGRLCLGTNQDGLANFHSATEVILSQPVTLPLTSAHVELIGSYPEDWIGDDKIHDKINQTANQLFNVSRLESEKIWANQQR